ncbi:hypothetical protein CEXT_313411, partial [Caerostris extrusa]
ERMERAGSSIPWARSFLTAIRYFECGPGVWFEYDFSVYLTQIRPAYCSQKMLAQWDIYLYREGLWHR